MSVIPDVMVPVEGAADHVFDTRDGDAAQDRPGKETAAQAPRTADDNHRP